MVSVQSSLAPFSAGDQRMFMCRITIHITSIKHILKCTIRLLRVKIKCKFTNY